MAGYSGTPLIKKLGSLPNKAKFVSVMTDSLDVILLFVNSETALRKQFGVLATSLVADGMVWVAWPKKSSGVATDLSFANVQQIGLDAGLVDVKICAVNDVWSGLKFVYRVKDRVRL